MPLDRGRNQPDSARGGSDEVQEQAGRLRKAQGMSPLRLLLVSTLAVVLCTPVAVADERFDRLIKQVERIRQLEFKTAVPWEMQTPEAVRARMQEGAGQGDLAADDKALVRLLHRLGLVPAGFDLRALLVDLYSDQIRGLYDPKTKNFCVVGQGDALAEGFTVEEVTAVHELCHALQDQHIDLQAYQARSKESAADESLARLSLVEGEAQLVSMDFTLGASGISTKNLGSRDAAARTAQVSEGKLAEAPLYFRRQLVFPYTAGMDLVLHVRKAGGWELVSRMFKDPPLSTEQVMHPRRYLERRDVPVRVLLNLPDQLGGFTSVAEDVGGEFLASVFLEQHLGYAASLAPAEGWGGDAWRVYARGEEDFALWFTHWDSAGDARQFSRAVREALRKGQVADVEVEDRGQDVVLYLGLPEDLRAQVAAALQRVSLRPVRQDVLVSRPTGRVRASAPEVEPEVRENRYLLDGDAFESLTHGFVLPIPSGWVPEPRKGDVQVPVSLVRLSGSARVFVQVLRLPVDTFKEPPTQKEAAQALALAVSRTFPGSVPVASRMLAGTPAFLEVECEGGGNRVAAYRAEVLGRTYTLLLSADPASYAASRKEFLGALRGMEFKTPGQF